MRSLPAWTPGSIRPAKYAGLAEGDAHVIRNAGGRATDNAVRSLVISHKLLGTREWFRHPSHELRNGALADEVIADLLPANVPIYGYIYDVQTGRLNEVKAATEAGKAKSAG